MKVTHADFKKAKEKVLYKRRRTCQEVCTCDSIKNERN